MKTGPMIIRTVIQQRERFLRDGLALLLDREPDIEVVGRATDPAELVDLTAEERPDAVLLELDADDWDAPRLAAALKKRQRGLRVVGMYDTVSRDIAQRSYRAGLRATFAYDEGSDALVAAVRGRTSAPVVTPMPRTRPNAPAALTPREVEVLQHVANGLMTRQISEVLGISPKTVENHKQRIFTKLGVQNQAHAVSVALRRGLLGSRSAVV